MGGVEEDSRHPGSAAGLGEADFGFGGRWRGGELMDEVVHAGLDLLETGLVLVHAALKRANALDLVELAKEHFAEHPGRPLAEERSLKGLDPIPHGDDDVQIVKGDRTSALRRGFMQNLHKTLLRQFPFAEDVGDVARNDRLIPPEKLAHLVLSKPHRLAVRADFEARVRAGLVDDDVAAGRGDRGAGGGAGHSVKWSSGRYAA